MGFERMVGVRYLMSKKRSRFLSVITIISLIGVILGVMALITVLAVMSGFENELRKKILGNNSHIYLLTGFGTFGRDEEETIMAKIPKIPNVVGISPTVTGEAFLIGNNRSNSGVMLKGVDPKSVRSVLMVDQYVTEGRFEDISNESDYPQAMIGRTLSERLQIDVGSLATLILPYGEVTPFGMTPKVRRLRIIGTFKTGISEFDERYIYCHIDTARKLFEMAGQVQFFEVRIRDLSRTKETSAAIRKAVGEFPYIIRDWMESNADFFSALKLEKTAMFIILTMIIIVAAFNIMATLIMVVTEKHHDIAILKSFGARDFSIMKIFLIQGTFIGIAGTVVGIALGLVLCFILGRYVHYPLNPNVYMIDSLPVDVRLLDVVLVAISAVVVSVLATLYPSWRAAQLHPVEGLRAE